MKNGKMYENMQKCLKICKIFSKYASTHQNMQKICKNKFFSFCLIYSFLEVLGHKLYFKPNLYFYVKYANMQNPNSTYNKLFNMNINNLKPISKTQMLYI